MKAEQFHKSRLAWVRQAFALIAIGTAGCAVADDFIKPGQETFKINLGAIVNDFDTSLRLDGPRDRGVEVDLDDLGLKRNLNSFMGSATWRIASNHRLGLQVFQTKRNAEKTTERTLEFKDQVIPAGTTLATESKTSFYIANYQYSFIKNDNMELAGVFGLYTANFKFKFNASTPPVDVDASTTAPLPMIGLSFDYYVTPQWTVSALAEGLKVKIGDVDGKTYNVGLSTDYMLTRNFGIGIAYSYVDLSVDVTKNGFTGNIGWKMNSILAYAQMRF
jgi:hypothetical protein